MGLTKAQWKKLQERVQGGGDSTPQTTGDLPNHRILIGVDPSLRGTGYAVIEWDPHHPRSLEYGTITCNVRWEHSRCLARISETLKEVVERTHPEVCVVEGLFFAQNLKTAIIMGEARGAALAVMGCAGLPIYEIAPRKVKQSVVGYGAASKQVVAAMIQRLFRLEELPPLDASDAMALAYAFAQEQGRSGIGLPKRV